MSVRPGPPRDGGRVAVTFAIFCTAVVTLLGLATAAGLVLAEKNRAYSIASDAARTGAQHIDASHYRATGEAILDPAAAQTAAAARLAQVGATGQASATTSQVSVTVWQVKPVGLLQLVGVDSITVTATATAQVRHGITTPGDVP